MVHLLSRGYVLPVVSYIRKCLEKLDTDISLIRYFVTEVSSPPPVPRLWLLTPGAPDWVLPLRPVLHPGNGVH